MWVCKDHSLLIRTEEVIDALKMLLAYMPRPPSASSLGFQVKHSVRSRLLKVSSFRTTNIRVIQNLL